jgi:hypothetical protein
MYSDRQENREAETPDSSRTTAETLRPLRLDAPLEEKLQNPIFRSFWLSLEYRDSTDPLYKKLPTSYDPLWSEETGFWKGLVEFYWTGFRLVWSRSVLNVRDSLVRLVRGMRRRKEGEIHR